MAPVALRPWVPREPAYQTISRIHRRLAIYIAGGGTHPGRLHRSRGNPVALLRRIAVAATATALLQAGRARLVGQSLPRRAGNGRSARNRSPRPRDGAQLHEARLCRPPKSYIRAPRRAGQAGAAARVDRPLIAAHFDVIITSGYRAALAAKQRAGDIPIVVTNSGDPIATGLAVSFAHPGGNVTGISYRLPVIPRCGRVDEQTYHVWGDGVCRHTFFAANRGRRSCGAWHETRAGVSASGF